MNKAFYAIQINKRAQRSVQHIRGMISHLGDIHQLLEGIQPSGEDVLIAALLRQGHAVALQGDRDLDRAARCIIQGGAYDNNLLCIAEKEVFVVDAVFDALLDAMDQGVRVRVVLERKQTDYATVDEQHIAHLDGREEERVGHACADRGGQVPGILDDDPGACALAGQGRTVALLVRSRKASPPTPLPTSPAAASTTT